MSDYRTLISFGLILDKLKILHQSVKRVNSQKVLGGNSYVCRSYRGKTGRGTFLPPVPPIMIRVNGHITDLKQEFYVSLTSSAKCAAHKNLQVYFIVLVQFGHLLVGILEKYG